MESATRPKIISIMPHGPAYNFSPNQLPDVYWEKPDGSLIGFWAREWLDLLGEEILKETDRYEWEVWQPDYRADKIYTKELETRVIHRLFPAKDRSYRPGIRSQNAFFSQAMISQIEKFQETPIILMLYSTHGFRVPFFLEILKIFGPKKNFPIFFRGGGQFKAPISDFFGLHRPLTYLCVIAEHFRLKKYIGYVDAISEQAESALREVAKVYNGRTEKLTMGCNFDFWIPVPSLELKRSIQDELNIPHISTVFFASGNFVPVKQLDSLLQVFTSIKERDDFFLIIAGHGDQNHTNMLLQLAAPLVEQRKAILHPYVTGESLRNIYWASDIYVSVSTNEGGPVSVMKAMACGLPVLSTPVGETADTMKKYGVGRFVPIRKYDEWARVVIDICERGLPRPLDIKIAREAYHWPNVAQRFISVFDDLLKSRG